MNHRWVIKADRYITCIWTFNLHHSWEVLTENPRKSKDPTDNDVICFVFKNGNK